MTELNATVTAVSLALVAGIQAGHGVSNPLGRMVVCATVYVALIIAVLS